MASKWRSRSEYEKHLRSIMTEADRQKRREYEQKRRDLEAHESGRENTHKPGRPMIIQTAEEKRQKRCLQQSERRRRIRERAADPMQIPWQIEERQVNCPNDLAAERIKLISVAKRQWGGVIPDKVLDELLPRC